MIQESDRIQTSKPVSELLTEESFGIETAGMVQGFSATLCMLVDLHVASSVWYALQDLSHFQVVCTPRFVKLFRFFCEHLQLARGELRHGCELR